MSRSIHANLTADQRAERRTRRQPRRPVRRQATVQAVIAAELSDAGLPPLVRTATGSVELRGAAARHVPTSLDDMGLVYPAWGQR